MHTSFFLCSNVTKKYGKNLVLKGINLTVEKPSIVGILGPNGAGKTTFMKILLGLVTPNTGNINIFGEDLFQNRNKVVRQIGAIIEVPNFFLYLSAKENLFYLASLTQKVPYKRIDEVLETVGLLDVANKKVETFSLGMKQRLGIAQALLPETRFLILDEPTNGLDPHGIASLRTLLKKLHKQHNISIFISSHIIHEIEQVCDRFIIIHKGEVILETANLQKYLQDINEVDITFNKEYQVPNDFIFPYKGKGEFHKMLKYTFICDKDKIPKLINELVAKQAEIISVKPHKMTLEDLFIKYTNEEVNDVRIDSF